MPFQYLQICTTGTNLLSEKFLFHTNPHSAADAGGTNSNEKVGASLPLLAV